ATLKAQLSRRNAQGSTCKNGELSPYLSKDVQRELKFLAGVRSRDNRPDPGPVARHRRERDALREHTFLEQPVRELHGKGALADDDRRHGAFAEPGVEAQHLEAGLEEPCVLPEPLDDLGFLLEDVQRREARRRNRGRVGRREEEWPRAVVK